MASSYFSDSGAQNQNSRLQQSRTSTDENHHGPDPGQKRRLEHNALEPAAKKKASNSDPLIGYGRHFGRTIHAMCNIHLLLNHGVRRLTEFDDVPEENFTLQERKELGIFQRMLKLIPNFEERLCNASEQELRFIGDMIQRGASGARSDDTKSLKSAIIDWITPLGVPLNPPLPRNGKDGRGFHHEATGSLLCPADLDWSDPEVKRKLRSPEYIVPGDQWPVLVYESYKPDPKDPWVGLFRSRILIRAFKHVFTSPSSVDKEPKATRSGNARIHGMTSVTIASIAYVATQVRFSLTTAPVFSRTDRATDSQRFYNSIINFLEDPDEQEEVAELLAFWNRQAFLGLEITLLNRDIHVDRQIFPEFFIEKRTITKDSALAKLKERRARKKEAAAAATAGVGPSQSRSRVPLASIGNH